MRPIDLQLGMDSNFHFSYWIPLTSLDELLDIGLRPKVILIASRLVL